MFLLYALEYASIWLMHHPSFLHYPPFHVYKRQAKFNPLHPNTPI